jgi:hypothetical protein
MQNRAKIAFKTPLFFFILVVDQYLVGKLINLVNLSRIDVHLLFLMLNWLLIN